jgi:hypothetical protein
MPSGLLFRLTDYLELVDWIGRILRDDKRVAIPESTPQTLQQLNIDSKHFCYLSQNFERQFESLVSRSYHTKEAGPNHRLSDGYASGLVKRFKRDRKGQFFQLFT